MKVYHKALILLCILAFVGGGCATGSQTNNENQHETAGEKGRKGQRAPIDSEKPQENETVWGLVGEMTFHQPACPRLTGVPAPEKRKFKSLYSALDADFHPCKECKPLKRSRKTP